MNTQGNIEEIEAREKAAALTVEKIAGWHSDCATIRPMTDCAVCFLLAQLKDREEKLAAEKERLAEEIKVVIAADSGDAYFKGRLSGLLYVQDRILQGGE